MTRDARLRKCDEGSSTNTERSSLPVTDDEIIAEAQRIAETCLHTAHAEAEIAAAMRRAQQDGINQGLADRTTIYDGD